MSFKDELCKVSVDTIIFIATSTALRYVPGGNLHGGAGGLVRMKSNDFLEYFLIDLAYYKFIPKYNLNISKNHTMDMQIYHALVLIFGKSIVDMALGHHKFIDNLIGIGSSEVVQSLVGSYKLLN